MSIGPGRGAGPAPGNGVPGAEPAARRAGGWLSRFPLWLKLAAAVVCLTGVGLAVLGVAGVSAFRGALLRQADQQVSAGAGQLAGHTFIVISGLARQYPRRIAPTPADTDRMMKRVAQEATRMADTLDDLSPPAPSDTPP